MQRPAVRWFSATSRRRETVRIISISFFYGALAPVFRVQNYNIPVNRTNNAPMPAIKNAMQRHVARFNLDLQSVVVYFCRKFKV